MQWQSYSDSFPRFHHLHRRIETRLGGVCSNKRGNEKWSATEKHLHLNILGLKGAFLALQALFSTFASRVTHQLPNFVSLRPEPSALNLDAFSLNWHGLEGYAFPPFNLVARVLNKAILDQTEVLSVAPVWQAQPWWPLLLQLLIQQPILLPVSPHLLIDPVDPHDQTIHPMFPRLHLGVFHISYSATKQRAFQQTLPNYSSQLLEPPHIKHMNPAGNAGAVGVVHGRLILFRHH